MLTKTLFPTVFFILLISIATSAFAATFKGKVIDADTKEPIEGAVVVAEWTEETTTPTATHTKLKDVKEVLTDKNGEWLIKGPRGRKEDNLIAIFTLLTGTYYTQPPRFYIFKPGYCPCPLVIGIEVCKERMKPYNVCGKEETLELPKLTRREDRWRAEGIGSSFITETKKIKNFLRLINEERRFLGLSEYPIGKELENEK